MSRLLSSQPTPIPARQRRRRRRRRHHHDLLSPNLPHPGLGPLARRDGQDCGETHHSCLDVQRPDSCCDNTSYCYVNAQNEARCCPVGSNCVADSPCSSQAYYCTVTATLPTVAAAANSTNTEATATTTTKKAPAAATERACCGRKCPQTSYFLCPPDLGGKCCPFGSRCHAGGSCLRRRTRPQAGSLPATGTATTAKDEGEDEADGQGGSPAGDHLPVGVKAGMGLCISVTLLVVVAAAAWFLFCRRRKPREGGIGNRAELTGCAARESPSPASEQQQQQQQQGVPSPAPVTPGADDGMPESRRNGTGLPVEMASVEAATPSLAARAVSPVSQERTYPDWAFAQPGCPDGFSELEGSQGDYPAERVPSPASSPPPPFSAASSSEYPTEKEGMS